MTTYNWSMAITGIIAGLSHSAMHKSGPKKRLEGKQVWAAAQQLCFRQVRTDCPRHSRLLSQRLHGWKTLAGAWRGRSDGYGLRQNLDDSTDKIGRRTAEDQATGKTMEKRGQKWWSSKSASGRIELFVATSEVGGPCWSMLFWTMLKHVVLCRHHSKGVPSHRHGAFLPPLGLQTYIDISISTSIYLFIDIYIYIYIPFSPSLSLSLYRSFILDLYISPYTCLSLSITIYAFKSHVYLDRYKAFWGMVRLVFCKESTLKSFHSSSNRKFCVWQSSAVSRRFSARVS